jgi:hypothetical protein
MTETDRDEDLLRFRASSNRELITHIRTEKRETFGTGRLRTRYQRCHEIAAKAMLQAPEGTVMVQGDDATPSGIVRQHSWLELPDGRTWDPVTCEFGTVRIVREAARYTFIAVALKISETGFFGWWS